jgi:hypothetical protein
MVVKLGINGEPAPSGHAMAADPWLLGRIPSRLTRQGAHGPPRTKGLLVRAQASAASGAWWVAGAGRGRARAASLPAACI